MKFGLFFFASAQREDDNFYSDFFELIEFAEQNDFEFVSVPERHFGEFGAPFPNPSLLCAAIAVLTRRVQIRACSFVAPLHHLCRAVEDWAVVDNLARGRLALSIGSGWNVNDFVFFPERYQTRRDYTAQFIEDFRAAWKSGRLSLSNGVGNNVELTLHPRPFSHDLPLWLTSSANPETFIAAGSAGCHVLTHLENQDPEFLREKVDRYREARARAGHDPAAGIVTLMQHTYVTPDRADLELSLQHLRSYLDSSLSLESRAVKGGGTMSGQKVLSRNLLDEERTREALLGQAVKKYSQGSALIGDLDLCRERVLRLEEAGVNEIACLIDFIPDQQLVKRGLPGLAQLQNGFREETIKSGIDKLIVAFTDPE